MVKRKNDDSEFIMDRLNSLEQDVAKLAQITSHQAVGLDKLSRVVELQTGTLSQLLATAENQNELLEGVASAIYQLNSASQETQSLLKSQQYYFDSFSNKSEE